MLIISWFIFGILFFILYSYLFCEIACDKKYKFKNENFFLIILFVLIICVINNFNEFIYIKPFINHLFALIIIKIQYKQNIIKTILGFCLIFLISFLSEYIFVSISIHFFDFSLHINNPFYYTIMNSIILLITYIIGTNKKLKNLYKFIINWPGKNKFAGFMIIIFFIFLIFSFVLYNNFINILPTYLFVIANIFFIAVFTIIVCYFKEKTTKNKLIYEYDQLLDYIQTYEKLLDEKSKNQHEYKNQLAVIRLMSKNKKTIEYIDSLLENKLESDLEIEDKLLYIPRGGLKGLIHYKIDAMKKKKLNYFIDISSELKNIKKWNDCEKNLQTISKILGVYLDNAIEACEDSKEKYIIFEAYVEDNKLVFKISNTFNNSINLDIIDKERYTTKSNGNGYGLALVKDLIEKSNYIEQEREINGIFFVQKLYIKKV